MTTEISIAMNGGNPIYGEHRVIIRVDDEAAGPYLVICGQNGDPQEGETGHEFFLCTEDEIDQFAKVCKDLLRQANEAAEQDGGKEQ
jgi:hypothetical protein